jgi:5-methylcytosine-specific restriction endonuclease McrA
LIQPLSKFSTQIHLPKGMEDKPSIREEFADVIKSQAGKESREVAKPNRIVDRKAVEKVRAYGRCEHCGKAKSKAARLAVHHIHMKSGVKGDDVPSNLVLLCWVCHQNVHQAGNPSREHLEHLAQTRITKQAVAPSARMAQRLIQEQQQ